MDNKNVEMSDFDKLSTQPQDNENYRNIATIIRDFQKCVNDCFDVGEKFTCSFTKETLAGWMLTQKLEQKVTYFLIKE